MNNLKETNDEELAKIAFDCLEELRIRGNKGLAIAQREIFVFHNSIFCLREKSVEIEAMYKAMESMEAMEDLEAHTLNND